MQEMPFSRLQTSKFSGRECSQTPLIFWSVLNAPVRDFAGFAPVGNTAEHCRFEPNIKSQFSSRMSYKNTHFNMYAKTSEQQERSRC